MIERFASEEDTSVVFTFYYEVSSVRYKTVLIGRASHKNRYISISSNGISDVIGRNAGLVCSPAEPPARLPLRMAAAARRGAGAERRGTARGLAWRDVPWQRVQHAAERSAKLQPQLPDFSGINYFPV